MAGPFKEGDTVRHPSWPPGEHAVVVSTNRMPTRLGRRKGRTVVTDREVVVKIDRHMPISGMEGFEKSTETDDHWMECGLEPWPSDK